MTAPMTAALAIGLVALTVPALLINLYFTLLILHRWPGLRHRLGALFTTCGADTSSCAIVVQTPYARLFGGAPNVYVGIVWNVALLGLALSWLLTDRVLVPWPYLVVAGASVLVGLYLVRALVVDLRQPCPL
jgi:uncharacterized membrane protein